MVRYRDSNVESDKSYRIQEPWGVVYVESVASLLLTFKSIIEKCNNAMLPGDLFFLVLQLGSYRNGYPRILHRIEHEMIYTPAEMIDAGLTNKVQALSYVDLVKLVDRIEEGHAGQLVLVEWQ